MQNSFDDTRFRIEDNHPRWLIDEQGWLLGLNVVALMPDLLLAVDLPESPQKTLTGFERYAHPKFFATSAKDGQKVPKCKPGEVLG